MSVSLLCQNVVTSASLSARHSIVVTGTRVVKQPGLSHRGGRGKHIVIPPRAGFLDNLLGVNNGNDGDKKVTRPKPGTKTVLMCSCCSNKGFEKCPGCNGTGKVRASFVVLRQDFHFHKKHLSSDAAHTAVTAAIGDIATVTTPHHQEPTPTHQPPFPLSHPQSKVNGNVMERFKCMVCQGMGGISCTNCNRGGKGLTPEQRGER